MAEYSIWDILNNIYNKRLRYPTKEELSGKLWMINRFLSMDTNLLEVVAYVSKYFFTLKERYYRLLYSIVPQTSSVRTKYSRFKEQEDSEILKKYSKFFGVNIRETKQYLNILRNRYNEKELLEFIGMEKK